jgi:hypothetical protein
MTKFRVVCFFVTIAFGICLATAQNSTTRSSSSARPGSDPIKAATKPLTPKSAMPPQHKSGTAAPVPHNTTKGRAADAELTRLEHQNLKVKGSTTGNPPAPNHATSRKPSATSAQKGSGIDFKYQKPVGGTQAAKPAARSANSSTPRVQKN